MLKDDFHNFEVSYTGHNLRKENDRMSTNVITDMIREKGINIFTWHYFLHSLINITAYLGLCCFKFH